MKNRIFISLAIAGIVTFSGCGSSGGTTESSTGSAAEETQSDSQVTKNTKDTYKVGNLEWQDTAEVLTEDVDFDKIDQYCEGLTVSGFTDWRVPTVKEFKELYPHKDELHYGWNKESYLFWTSSRGGIESNPYALIFNMSNGKNPPQYLKLIEQYKDLGGYPVRCVREVSQ